MSPFTILALLLTLAALTRYVNHRFIGLPATVGLMLLSLLLSLGIMAADCFGLPLKDSAQAMVSQVDLGQTLLGGMLSFLLFAGALHVNWKALHEQRWRIATLAFGATLLSTGIVAALAWVILRWIGLPLSPLYCLIFGALISPTDPIAVLALLKQANAPASLATKIAGESLFNDGVGVVLFLVFTELLADGSGSTLDATHVVLLLLREAGGGIALGLALGWITFRLLKSVDDYQLEVLLTLALVTGGYALANALHMSGPLAIVTAGVLIGNPGRSLAMSEKTRNYLDMFWELIDEILNALLFVLLGLEVLTLRYKPGYVLAAALAIPAVLLARWLSVGGPGVLLRLFQREVEHGALALLTWGGLRGAISVALALSLPAGPERDLLLTLTYAVVAFSILIQATTMPWLLRRTLPAA
jgi:CPA1 family monovalent cation:H+ antiporter